MYAENGAANVISASQFFFLFIWTGTRSLGWLRLLGPGPIHCLLILRRVQAQLVERKGRSLCASPWPASNCSCTFKRRVEWSRCAFGF
jgi:hypothetical protein